MIIDLSDPEVRERAEAAVLGFRTDLAGNPDLAEDIYGGEGAMLRQYLDDCGFPGISVTEARVVRYRLNTLPAPDKRCADCSMALEQYADKALDGEVQMVWVIVDSEDWVCDQTGNEHRAEDGTGQRYFEVEFTKTVHVIADSAEAAYDQANAEVLDHVRSTGVIDWSNYDDCVRQISKAEY